jgi:16S rRNA (guanine527-N7)-methyltransferase
MDADRLHQLLTPFGLRLAQDQTAKILTCLDLLMRWNEKINLTAIRSPEEAVTRHFGESLFISTRLRMTGRLLDIGTGAGFPGLALKIAFPELEVTLLEPVGKKRAFLKEVIRVCELSSVRVLADRLEDFLAAHSAPEFDFATMRAVGNLEVLVPFAAKALKIGGNCLLWLSTEQGLGLAKTDPGLTWKPPLVMPISGTEIWLGEKGA